MQVPTRLADFEGVWRLRRRIEDALTGQDVTGEGQAELVADGQGGLIHDETLRLHYPGTAPLTGTRRYLWRSDGAYVAVLFADGRPFHRITLDVTASEDVHDCAPDRYAGHYDFTAWPEWTARWTVCGPRKDYVMRTRFCRPD